MIDLESIYAQLSGACAPDRLVRDAVRARNAAERRGDRKVRGEAARRSPAELWLRRGSKGLSLAARGCAALRLCSADIPISTTTASAPAIHFSNSSMNATTFSSSSPAAARRASKFRSRRSRAKKSRRSARVSSHPVCRSARSTRFANISPRSKVAAWPRAYAAARSRSSTPMCRRARSATSRPARQSPTEPRTPMPLASSSASADVTRSSRSFARTRLRPFATSTTRRQQ